MGCCFSGCENMKRDERIKDGSTVLRLFESNKSK